MFKAADVDEVPVTGGTSETKSGQPGTVERARSWPRQYNSNYTMVVAVSTEYCISVLNVLLNAVFVVLVGDLFQHATVLNYLFQLYFP